MHTDLEMRSTLGYDFMRYMNAGSREMSDELFSFFSLIPPC